MDDDSIIANYSYSPSSAVKMAHSILHLDSNLQPVSNEFGITYDSYWNSYSKSLLPVPLICMVLGIAAVLALQIALCSRLCCYSCRCLPNINNEDEVTGSSISKAMGPRFVYLVVFFIVSAVIAIGFDQMLIVGSVSLTKGVNRGLDALDYLQNTFTDLTNDGNDLITDGNSLDSNLQAAASSGCSQASVLDSYLPQYFDYVNDYLNYVEPVPDKCEDTHDGLRKYGINYKNASVWVLYVMIMVGLVIYAVGLAFKNKLTLQVGIGVTELLLIVLFVLVGFEMILMMVLADFCMDPILNVNQVVPRSIADVTFYYTTCYGENPFQSDINSLDEFVVDFQAALTLLQSVCPSNQYVSDCFPILTSINYTLSNITAEIACPPIQSQLNHVLEDGLCDKSFQGWSLIWLGQHVCSALLIICSIVVSLTYQYFGQYWNDINSQPTAANDPMIFLDVEVTPSQDRSANEFYYNTNNTLHANNPPPSAPLDKSAMNVSPL